MRVELKYALPLAQMMLAVIFLRWSYLQDEAARLVSRMHGPAPAFTLVIAINAPAVLPRIFWANYLSTLWDDLTLIAAAGLLWYWVALNIDSWRKRKTVFIFSWTPLRLAGDMLLIVTGVWWGLVCVAIDLPLRAIIQGARGEALRIFFPTWQGAPWFIAVTGLHLSWSFVLIYFFGRDFIHCIFRKNPATASPA